MKSNIVRIGNSKGIRLPKSVLELCGLKDFAEIKVIDNVLTIRPVHIPRLGWSEAFSAMARHKDDKLLDEDSSPALHNMFVG